MRIRGAFSLIALCLFALAGSTTAVAQTFEATLDGNYPGGNPNASGTATLNLTDTAISWGIVAHGLTAGGTGESARLTGPGGVIVFLDGTWEHSSQAPITSTGSGTVPVAPATIDAVRANPQDFTVTVFSWMYYDSGAIRGTLHAAGNLPGVLLESITVTEGDSGTTLASFPIRLNRPSTDTVTVHYATESFPAQAPASPGGDYVPANGSIVFPPGVTDKTIDIQIIGDTDHEWPQKTFFLDLSSPQNALLLDTRATCTIVDNDPETPPAPTAKLSIGDATVAEGDSGTTDATFSVTLSKATQTDVTVHYTTTAGSAAAGSDFVPTAGTLTFPAGQTSRTISIPVNGDSDAENDETFTVDLSAPVNALLLDASGTGTIEDDDSASLPLLSVDDVQVAEGNAGTTQAVVTLTLSQTADASVHWETHGGTAVAGSDFVAASGTAIFEHANHLTIPLTILGDTLDEGDESFTIELSSALDAALDRSSVVVTIRDDDDEIAPRPRAIVLAVGSVQGNAGSHFRTAMQMLNPTATVMRGVLRVHPIAATLTSGDVEIPYELAPGEAQSFTDFFAAHDLTGLATLDVLGDTPVLPRVATRIYNDGGAAGTTGFTLPLLTLDHALAAGDRASLFAPADPIAMRFNVGLRTLDEGATLEIEVHDHTGALLKTSTHDYAPNWFNQFSGADFAGLPLSAGDYLAIRVQHGSAILYGATIDNITNDASVELATR
jgi:Calx-beta domain-containing protein